MATSVPDLPLWAWNLIIAIQRHEDLHGKEDTCLNGVLNAVPDGVRSQAQAISVYVQKASSNEFGKRIEEKLGGLVGSLAGIPPVATTADRGSSEGEEP
ncbi:hypothetical protein OG785_45665 [Streptomyces sp. NBC_00006]|uniref:hypothetical protein n=1 Tax=Streptomyces sp. NBC_00006 TaxID=2975619 RepID=UPI0022580214|nr:hypothetical protein [Streptomyces sp. NBC_00006]MCX5537740.1 hypothetical protein [Streptomyces sp. NBC_00006]MCX5537849.1 hypothetical protein [Streptomyces sp. NBC_00006]